MLNYALIGLGGALGSMSRAWVAIAMARLTGPEFPWGTILINVVGSFLIGFVASLTATDGRLAGLADVRTFVMVGFCGGFTTFSSFSLQTLDLARDGRAGQAFGNVALSVLVCLGAVAIGHLTGVALRPGRETAEVAPTGRGGSVLAVLDRLNGDGRTIVVITHEDHVVRHARRRVEMRDGHVSVDEPVGVPA